LHHPGLAAACSEWQSMADALSGSLS
jgi:hypothetical protein